MRPDWPEAELSGLATWELLLPTASLTSIAEAISGQPEFRLDHGGESNAQYVTDLYVNGTGVAPTADQLNSAVASLNAGMNRGDLLLQIASSARRRRRI